jgi:hypothetical protein
VFIICRICIIRNQNIACFVLEGRAAGYGRGAADDIKYAACRGCRIPAEQEGCRTDGSWRCACYNREVWTAVAAVDRRHSFVRCSLRDWSLVHRNDKNKLVCALNCCPNCLLLVCIERDVCVGVGNVGKDSCRCYSVRVATTARSKADCAVVA